MDRNIRIMQGDGKFAEMLFNYDSAQSGRVCITINNIVDIGSGLKTEIPIFHQEVVFSHGVITTIEELNAYDLALLKTMPVPVPDNGLGYVIDDVQYRYLITTEKLRTIGLANCKVSFTGNSKQLQFWSARRVGEDIDNIITSAWEHNTGFLTRILAESFGEELPAGSFQRIDWH